MGQQKFAFGLSADIKKHFVKDYLGFPLVKRSLNILLFSRKKGIGKTETNSRMSGKEKPVFVIQTGQETLEADPV